MDSNEIGHRKISHRKLNFEIIIPAIPWTQPENESGSGITIRDPWREE